MKNFRVLLSFAAFLLISICALQAQSKHFAGVWKNDVSSVRYEIAIDGKKVLIKAIDDSDGEVLEVSEVKVMAKDAINFTMHTPSTDWYVHPTITLKGKKTFMEALNNSNDDILQYEKQ